MDEQTHDLLHRLAIAREKKEKAQDDEDTILTQLVIHIEKGCEDER